MFVVRVLVLPVLAETFAPTDELFDDDVWKLCPQVHFVAAVLALAHGAR